MTVATPRRERRSLLWEPDRGQLLPLDLSGLEPEIEAANSEAHATVDRCEAGRRAASEAAAAAKAAPEHDRNAIEAAAVAGAPAPAPIAPAKRAEADELAATAAGLKRAAQSAIFRLYDAIEDNYDAYLASRQQAREDEARRVRELVAELTERLPALEREGELLELASHFHNNVRSCAIAPVGRTRRDQFERARAQLASQARNGPVQFDTWHLLAALSLLIEERG